MRRRAQLNRRTGRTCSHPPPRRSRRGSVGVDTRGEELPRSVDGAATIGAVAEIARVEHVARAERVDERRQGLLLAHRPSPAWRHATSRRSSGRAERGRKRMVGLGRTRPRGRSPARCRPTGFRRQASLDQTQPGALTQIASAGYVSARPSQVTACAAPLLRHTPSPALIRVGKPRAGATPHRSRPRRRTPRGGRGRSRPARPTPRRGLRRPCPGHRDEGCAPSLPPLPRPRRAVRRQAAQGGPPGSPGPPVPHPSRLACGRPWRRPPKGRERGGWVPAAPGRPRRAALWAPVPRGTGWTGGAT